MEKSKLKINKERVRHIKMSNAINDRIKDTINDTLDEMKVSELQSMVETLGMNSVVLDDFLRDVATQMYEKLETHI
tara:strand:+ start:297 stop:524 length:228 start_codon:yes stop_codon:yes gene_type:complete